MESKEDILVVSDDPDNFALYKGKFSHLTVDEVSKHIHVNYDTFTAKQNGCEVICKEPRGTAWFSKSGHNFVYSGKVMKSEPFNPFITELAEELEKLTGTEYCSMLANLYAHGKSGMGYHVDPLYDPDNPTIQIWKDDTAVISVGATRKFAVRELKNSPSRKYYYYQVENGDLMRMFNKCQETYQHAVKIEKREDSVGPRFSLVFKKHI